MTWNSCYACRKKRNEDDLVWIDDNGRADMNGHPYCVGCANEEKDYENITP